MADISKKYPTINTGGGLFLKIADGETVKVRLVSDPIYFDNIFKDTMTSRFAWVIWNHDAQTAQIWATNGATYNSIKDLVLDEEYGDPSEYDIKITRTGVEQQTRYSVRPGTKRYDLTDKEKAECDKLDPIQLIDKADSTQHVMWLEEHREEKKLSGREQAKKVRDALGNEDPEEEEINLEDILF